MESSIRYLNQIGNGINFNTDLLTAGDDTTGNYIEIDDYHVDDFFGVLQSPTDGSRQPKPRTMLLDVFVNFNVLQTTNVVGQNRYILFGSTPNLHGCVPTLSVAITQEGLLEFWAGDGAIGAQATYSNIRVSQGMNRIIFSRDLNHHSRYYLSINNIFNEFSYGTSGTIINNEFWGKNFGSPVSEHSPIFGKTPTIPPTWDSTISYVSGFPRVEYLGNIFQSIIPNNLNNTPPSTSIDSTEWRLVGDVPNWTNSPDTKSPFLSDKFYLGNGKVSRCAWDAIGYFQGSVHNIIIWNKSYDKNQMSELFHNRFIDDPDIHFDFNYSNGTKINSIKGDKTARLVNFSNREDAWVDELGNIAI